jgi:hypothetical protein
MSTNHQEPCVDAPGVAAVFAKLDDAELLRRLGMLTKTERKAVIAALRAHGIEVGR